MKVYPPLYDQGSTKIPEDGIIFKMPAFFGVIDGLSGIYLPEDGPMMFDGKMSGGQFVASVISSAFINAKKEQTLEEILLSANTIIRKRLELERLSFDQPFIPAAAFIAAKINEEIGDVHIIQGGDSLAVWKTKNGKFGAIKNGMFNYEKELRQFVSDLMKEYDGDRQKMWEGFRPILMKYRRANFNIDNGAVCVINGHPQVERFWKTFDIPIDDLELMIFFTDGLVPCEWMNDEIKMAKKVIDLFYKNGLKAVLVNTRVIEGLNKKTSHEDFAEATAIAINFLE